MKSFGFFGVLVLVVGFSRAAVVDAGVRPEDNEVVWGRAAPDQSHWILAKVLEDCGADVEMLSCLGVKAVAALSRAARMGDISLGGGVVTLVRTAPEDEARDGRALLTEAQVQDALAQDATPSRSSRLLDMVYDAVRHFLRTHSLQLSVPEGGPETLQRALEEGRGKLKKKLLPLALLVGLKLFAVIPLVLGFIALVAAKALIVGKLALIIAAILAVQKFIAGGGSSGLGGFGKVTDGWSSGASTGGWSSGGSGSSGGGGGGYYRRSMEVPQQLAYAAQIPTVDSNSQ